MRLILEKRLDIDPRRTLAIRALALVLALVAGAILLLSVGVNPFATYWAMLVGALGDKSALGQTLLKAIPLMLTGLAVSVAFRMRFWNIGAEGQFAMGVFATSLVALFGPPALPWLPQALWLPLMMMASIVAGALWGLIPAALKAYRDVNEIIITLMLNYIAIGWLEYLFYGPWKNPEGFGFPGSAPFPPYTWLPMVAPDQLPRVHWGLIFALLATLILWFVMSRTRWGYEIRLLGENPNAARYAGISIVRNTLLIMVVSGGLAGLAGMVEIAGIAHRLQQGIMLGYGFTGIIVAWLARLNPWGVIGVAFALAVLLVGGNQIQISMGLPAAVALVLQGLLFFFVLGGDVFTQYRLRVVEEGKELA
ncbi:MAG: ABC transporter permease [Ardenticatenales bacterium]|nr:ABC transporter permease [Ardenticatenales bacterium]